MPSRQPEKLARIALDAVARLYPNAPQLRLHSPADLAKPDEVHPAFCGSYDWHSAVHGHWALARLARCFPRRGFASAVQAQLAASLAPEKVDAEREYLERFRTFEAPYGLAWLLLLSVELEHLSRDGINVLSAPAQASFDQLSDVASQNLLGFFVRLPFPIRSGQHSQSAFALSLALDAARELDDQRTAGRLEEVLRMQHGDDRDLPIHLEPSGFDFLSPALGAADAMRRILEPAPFSEWLDRAIPPLHPRHQRHSDISRWLRPLLPPDRSDGKLSHLDGLNLSRAWMMEGIGHSLPPGDPRIRVMRTAAQVSLESGLDETVARHWAGAHWLATFAVYALSHRGISSTASGIWG